VSGESESGGIIRLIEDKRGSRADLTEPEEKISGRDSEDLAHSTVSVHGKSWLENRRIDRRKMDEDSPEMKDCRSTDVLTTFNGSDPACECS
jgi:hypothetical protein